MIVYADTKRDFIKRVSDDTLADYLEEKILEKLHRKTQVTERRAWENSLSRMGLLLGSSTIPDDAGVAIEYVIPMSSKRIDILVSGYDEKGSSHVVIVELKQWSSLKAVDGMNDMVETRVGGSEGLHLHPSYQAWSYAQLMHNFSAVVQDSEINVWPCAYLHNYKRRSNDPLDAVQYHYYESLAPAFTHTDSDKLKEFIARYVRRGDAGKVLFDIENGEVRPSKSLQDALVNMLNGNSEFVMIDKQKEVYEHIVYCSRRAKQTGKKEVLIVKGGPGTGKSVVAINTLVELIKDGQVVQYVTKNSAPRNVFAEKLVGSYSSRLKKRYSKAYVNGLFKGSGCFVDAKPNEFGTIIVDEAHRLNEKSGMYHNQGENQIKEIINAAWCSVFFIDEHQRVTTYDAGSIDSIQKFAKLSGAVPREFVLSSQFRCNGSDGYLSWLDHVLYGEESATTDLRDANYDFRVVDSPEELRSIINARNTNGVNARIVAGYCWNWIRAGKNDSSVHDIKIEDFEISWNLGNSLTWAIDRGSVNEAGCIHTCQGLEFEHVGVIVGPDMFVKDGEICTDFTKRASTDQSIKGLKGKLRQSPSEAVRLGDAIVRNTYRTLLTRGSKSCTVYCCDKALAEYLKRMAGLSAEKHDPEILYEIAEELKYREYLPLYSMRAACGNFGGEEHVDHSDGWVKISGRNRLNPNLYIVKAVGHSMEPMIKDGEYCIFEYRENEIPEDNTIVLAEHTGEIDAETHGAYSIKKFVREGEKIILRPLNRAYKDIELDQSRDYRIVGVLRRDNQVILG